MVLCSASEAAGDINKTALHMAATMTATATAAMTGAVQQQPSGDIRVPEIKVQDNSDPDQG